MSDIESVLHESRVFLRRQHSRNRPTSPAWPRTTPCAEADKHDFEGFWARHARDESAVEQAIHQDARQSKAPFFKWFHDGELNASYCWIGT